MGRINRDDAIAGAFEELPTSIFLLSSLRWLTLQKKNIQQSFSFCEIFLRRLTLAKKKNSLTEKSRVRMLGKSLWLTGCPG